MTERQKESRRTVLQNLELQFPDSDPPKRANGQKAAARQQTSGISLAPKGVHAGLWLDKYITNLGSFKASSQNEGEASQQKLVNDVAKLEIPTIYTSFYKRWVNHLEATGTQSREFATKGRMAVGLGNEGVLETSVALHRTYGVPYIPGSALKGLAATYARLMAGDGWQPDSEAYKTVFGNTESAGYVTFFDALYIPVEARKSTPQRPESRPNYPLHTDIITVHHPNYYTGVKANEKIDPPAPADWDSPTPIPFLSATGTYLIALAAPDLDPDWIEKTFDLLEQALLVLGIGAKTSSGYGRMEVPGKKEQVKPSVTIKMPTLDMTFLQADKQITGIVVKQDQRPPLQQLVADGESSQFLAYRDSHKRDYPLEQVVIVIAGQEANWSAGDQKNCRVLRLENLGERLIVFCETTLSKKKKKK